MDSCMLGKHSTELHLIPGQLTPFPQSLEQPMTLSRSQLQAAVDVLGLAVGVNPIAMGTALDLQQQASAERLLCRDPGWDAQFV